ncbi:MAG: hypothetical protein E6J34_01375 [Chloroflexi bacterium]|nr:MAG: hypothetical protein E6J34_01375 [Chloroflexota bacterium]
MSYNAIVVLLGWLTVVAIFFVFIVLLRYLHHKERMALITHGMHPDVARKQRRSRGILRAGLITGMVGLALTVGLYPVGFFLPFSPAAPFHLGPWLLPGLIPLGVGLALIISYYLEQNNQGSEEEHSEQEQDNIISLERRMDREV